MSAESLQVPRECSVCGTVAVWAVDCRPKCINCGTEERAIQRDMLFLSGVSVTVTSGLDPYGTETVPFGQLEFVVQANGVRGPVASTISSADLSPDSMRQLAGFLLSHAQRVEDLLGPV